MEDPPILPDDRNPHTQVQQDLKGDRHQAIGQAIDSPIVNFAGGGYIFVHQMLLEYLAEMSIE
jgi:hypothetical protein